jgi:hypothetical protein
MRATRMIDLFAPTVISAMFVLSGAPVDGAALDGPYSVASVKINSENGSRSSLGTIIHSEPGIVFVLVPAHIVADDSTVLVKLPGVEELAAEFYPVFDGAFDMWLVTIAPPAGKLFSPESWASLLYRPAIPSTDNADAVASGIDVDGRPVQLPAATTRIVAPGIINITIAGSTVGEGSPVFDSIGRVVGFVTRNDGNAITIVSTTAAAEIVRGRWAVPANKLIRIMRFRRIPTSLSVQDVETMIAHKGFNHPRGKVPDVTEDVPLSLGDFGRFVQERLVAGTQSEALRNGSDSTAKAGVPGHDYIAVRLEEFDGVLDRATGLLWLPWNRRELSTLCRSEDGKSLSVLLVTDCLRRLREIRAAGYRDWRIPTLEELASLMEVAISTPPTTEIKGLFLDAIFKVKWHVFWTADRVNDPKIKSAYWGVCFSLDDPMLPCASPISLTNNMRAQLMVVRNTD